MVKKYKIGIVIVSFLLLLLFLCVTNMIDNTSKINIENKNEYAIITIESPYNEIFYSLNGSNDISKMNKYEGPFIVDYTEYNQLYPLSTYSVENLTVEEYGVQMLLPKLLIIKAMIGKGNGEYIYLTESVDINNVFTGNMDMISISIEEEDFLGQEKGIYCLDNCYQNGKTTERKAYFEYFDCNGERVISQDIGIRIAGHTSRRYLQKGFRIYPMKEGDHVFFTYDFFNTGAKNIYAAINLKNGGNNCNDIKFKNAMLHEVAKDAQCNFDTQYAKPVVVYINGEYWGVYVLTEDYDEEYFVNHYDILDDVIMLRANGGVVYEVRNGELEDALLWEEMIAFAQENSMEDSVNYDKLCDMIDINSFSQWLAFELYIDNTDFSYTDRDWDNNTYVWRSKNVSGEKIYCDGRWRWMLQDVDASFSRSEPYNTVKLLLNSDHITPTKILFRKLIVNDDFRKIFIEDLYNMSDSVLPQKAYMEYWNRYLNVWQKELEKNYLRFGMNCDVKFYTQFNYNCCNMREQLVGEMVQAIVEYTDVSYN